MRVYTFLKPQPYSEEFSEEQKQAYAKKLIGDDLDDAIRLLDWYAVGMVQARTVNDIFDLINDPSQLKEREKNCVFFGAPEHRKDYMSVGDVVVNNYTNTYWVCANEGWRKVGRFTFRMLINQIEA